MAEPFDPSVTFIHDLVTGAGTLQSESIGKACQAMAHSLSLSMQNASSTQQQMQQIGNAIVAQAVKNIMG